MADRGIFYILDANRTPVPEPDLRRFALWFEQERNRRVAAAEIDCCSVSTVFLGIDHRFGRPGRPILFETMAFGDGELGGLTQRCCTWAEAEAQHRDVCARLEAMIHDAAAEIDRVLP